MQYIATPDTLTITLDEQDRVALRELREENKRGFDGDELMVDFLEPLVCNSELQWIPEGSTGDLTTAPMLGILGEVVPEPVPVEKRGYGLMSAGFWDGKARVQAIEQRWAWMNYQVQSLLDALLNDGRAVLVASN